MRYAAKTEDGILMDYVDGETLDQFANSHPDYFRNRKNANRFLRQLLDVVGYLHQHQIVHLDLKPQNILITRIGHDVKLIDLGYCYTDTYNDTTGRTDKYAAPEQLNESAKVDARTDIYAIGRILQTLPCAHYYNKVIQLCTAKEMESRYASADEILQSMHSRWPWWTAALAVMFIAALVIYYVLHLSSDVTECNSRSSHFIARTKIPADKNRTKHANSRCPLGGSNGAFRNHTNRRHLGIASRTTKHCTANL